MMIANLFLGFCPGIIHKFFRRMLPGNSISSKARLSFGNFIFSKNVRLDEGCKLGVFVFFKTESLAIGKNSRIASLVFANTRKIIIGEGVVFSSLVFVRSEWLSGSELKVGDHCSIFPFTWIEPGYGVDIGNNVGIGGFNLIFTHGSWPDYLQGGPVKFGKVQIQDNVWLPWRVFILPDVVIGHDSVISGNSLIGRNIAPNSFAGGSPAKVIKENFYAMNPTMESLRGRYGNLIAQFSDYLDVNYQIKTVVNGFDIIGDHFRVLLDPKPEDIAPNDFAFYLSETEAPVDRNVVMYASRTFFSRRKKREHELFIHFLRRYGIRLYQRD